MTENLPSTQMIPSSHEMMVFENMAKAAVNSKMYKGIGDESGVMAIMLSARELGIPPMSALNGGLNIINGKVEISARLMNALIRKAGHSIQEKSSNASECCLVGQRGDNKDMMTVTFTIEEARTAGLVKSGGGWSKWPKDMLYARCLSRLARRLFADVIGVGYVEGEIRDAQYEVIEQQIEPTNSDPEVLEKFLSKFDTEEAMLWSSYISQIREKFNITDSQIIQKFESDPTKAEANFSQWKKQNERQT